MATQRWNIDPSHSGVHFSVRHLVISKVRGAFDRFSGAFELDEAAPALASVTVEIDAASIDTRDAKRDEHLRSPDFFDVARFPTLTFRSSRVEPRGGSELAVTGQLSLHGVTREVVLVVEKLGGGKDPWGNQRLGFAARTSIDRRDFGLGWNQLLETGGVLVGEKVEIEIEVQAVMAQAAVDKAS